MPRTTQRAGASGFTLVEMAITLAVMAVLVAVAYPKLGLQKTRVSLAGTTADLHAMLRNARQNALSTGRDTIVMVFPNADNPERGTGRFIAYVDTTTTGFFGSTAPNFAGFDAQRPLYGDNLLGTLDLPPGITIGLGGATAPTLAAPFDTITAAACSFCATAGDQRGAIAFDSRGRARFYGAAASIAGGTVGLQATPAIQGYRLFVISAGNGAVRVLNNG